MILDTGASSVVLTHEAAKAAGLPLEVLSYSVTVDTANGRTRAAPVTLQTIAVGGIVERDVAGADRAAGTVAPEPARHELPQPPGRLGGPRRPAGAAGVSVDAPACRCGHYTTSANIQPNFPSFNVSEIIDL